MCLCDKIHFCVPPKFFLFIDGKQLLHRLPQGAGNIDCSVNARRVRAVLHGAQRICRNPRPLCKRLL
nr:MAG TPA: hypothetical protein [Caudoviricetes sp.]